MNIFRMHQLGYKLNDGNMRELTPLQVSFLVLAHNEDVKEKNKNNNNKQPDEQIQTDEVREQARKLKEIKQQGGV